MYHVIEIWAHCCVGEGLMEIKKTITLNIQKKGNDYIIGDLPTLQLVMGSTAVAGNYNFYKITKIGTSFGIDAGDLLERKRVLQGRLAKLQSTIDILNQIMRTK